MRRLQHDEMNTIANTYSEGKTGWHRTGFHDDDGSCT